MTTVYTRALYRIPGISHRTNFLSGGFIERLWRTVKYEDLYIKEYPTVQALADGLEDYFRFYNQERLHQSLGHRTPAEVHFAGREPET